MPEEPKLEPCPFCGGEVFERHALWPSDGDVDAIIHVVHQPGCGMVTFSVGAADDGKTTRAAWNTRPAPAQTDDALALHDKLAADRGANRPLDAEIAVALYKGGGHADQRDNTYARLPSKSDECAPGTYWISAFSGLSLRTAPDYSSDPTLKRLALAALEAKEDGRG